MYHDDNSGKPCPCVEYVRDAIKVEGRHKVALWIQEKITKRDKVRKK